MNIKNLVVLSRNEQMQVKAGNQLKPDDYTPDDQKKPAPTVYVPMVKDSSIT